MDHTGVPALRARKEAFINRLASSLVLQKNAKHVVRGGGGDKKLNKELKLFNVFRKELYDHPARESATVDEHLTLRMIEEEEEEDDDDDNKVKPSSAYETVVGATPAPVSLPLTESSGGSGGVSGGGGRVDELAADGDEEGEEEGAVAVRPPPPGSLEVLRVGADAIRSAALSGTPVGSLARIF